MQTYGLQWDSANDLPFMQGAIVARYYNGRYAYRPVSFPRGRVWIDVMGNAPNDCHWADVESGDLTPQAFPPWNNARHQMTGEWGGFYCNRSTLPQVLEVLGSMPADLWLATLDGETDPPELATLPSTIRAVAVQAFPASVAGIAADCSLVINQAYWNDHHG